MPKYTKFQYWLWLASGSEISVLLNCPNDYNRHANIGMMICITSIFAAVTSSIAGLTFADGNLPGVFIFSLIWAVLIFSLDRSMVNSIKKDPTQSKPRTWSFLLPRLLLAIILSFFMSIPLDHIVFRERIAYQMQANNTADWLRKKADLDKGYGTDRQEQTVVDLARESNNLDQQLQSGCPWSNYKQMVKNYNDSVTKKALLQKMTDRARREKNNYYALLKAQRQDTTQPIITDKRYDDLNIDWENKEQALSIIKRNTTVTLDSAQSINARWENELKEQKHQTVNNKALAENELNRTRLTIHQQTDTFKTKLDSFHGFDTQFETLFLMPNLGVQVLKWLIFLGLTVIEILPTYLKLRTPTGQYDWEIYGRDQETAIGIKVRLEKFEGQAADVEEHRKEKETALNKQLIDRIAAIEEKLANEQLNAWEEEVS